MEEDCVKVNIIAYSKGGLNAKYMCEHLDMEVHVFSLTTLCTPHKASPLANAIYSLPRWILPIIAFFINFWYCIFKDKYPESLKVYKELSYVHSMEEETFNRPSFIYCQSYLTKLKKASDDFILGLPLLFCHFFEKGKYIDGLVIKDLTIFGADKGNSFL